MLKGISSIIIIIVIIANQFSSVKSCNDVEKLETLKLEELLMLNVVA